MAPSYQHRAGSGGSPQNRRFHGHNDRSSRGHFVHQASPSSNNAYATVGSQRRLEHRYTPMTSYTAQKHDASSAYHHLYPSQIPDDYIMVKPKDGSIPRYYVDNLAMEFYLRPAREVRAVFSTNNGALPVRTLSHTPDTATDRQMYLWCAEDIQNHANSVRKKHWNLMKSMPQPTCWEDLYDYFDCVDLFHHGALNLWNLIGHLVHENKMLRDNLIHGISFEVGMWCDEWLARNQNKTRLRDFSSWGNVLGLFDGSELEEIQQLDPFSLDILRTALAHRQHQLAGKLGLHPPVYPGNTAAAQLHQSNMQNWLAGHPFPTTPSGLDHFVSSKESKVLESIPESPTKLGVASQTPLVVDGSSRPVERPLSHPSLSQGPLTADGSRRSSHSGAMGSFVRPSNTPLTTAPGLGNWTPFTPRTWSSGRFPSSNAPFSGPPAATQVFNMPPPMHGPPLPSSSKYVPSDAVLGGEHGHSSRMRTESLSREPPSRFDPGQQGQNGTHKEQKSPSIPSPQPNAPGHWEKVGETENGPLWRRSPVKEYKFSKAGGIGNRSSGSRESDDSAVMIEPLPAQAEPATTPTAHGATAATSGEVLSSIPNPQDITDGKSVVPPAEAEAQSKPPSEEALPETLEEGDGLRGDKSPGANGKGQPIKVSLPVTPTKKQQPERSPTPPNDVADSCHHSESGNATAGDPMELRTESPKYGKGSYRNVFTAETAERVDLYERPNTTPARSQPIILMASVSGNSNEETAKNAFDDIIINSLAQQPSGSGSMQNAPQKATDAPKKTKKNKKSGKNKKKHAAKAQAQAPEPSSPQNPTEEPSTTLSERQEGQAAVPINHPTNHGMNTASLETEQDRAPSHAAGIDDEQANTVSAKDFGGPKQLSHETQSAEPSGTAERSELPHFTLTSKPKDPEIATLCVVPSELPNAERTIKPQSQESTPSGVQAPPEKTSVKRKLAPIPLVIPKPHHNNSGCSSRTVSRTVSPSDSPTKTDEDGKMPESGLPQHQPPNGKQESKKRRSPKKKKAQGQDHLGDKNEQSSFPPTSAPGLPPTSVWGKARSATTIDSSISQASTISTKGSATGSPRQEEKSKK